MRVSEGKLYVKKGFTLLELLLALGMSSILISYVIHQLVTYKILYNKSIQINRQEVYASEALMFIEYQIQNSVSAHITENDIGLKYSDETIEKHIRMSASNNIVITHLEKGNVKAVNNILTNVKKFIVNQKGAVIYISIETKDSKVFERCLEIKERM